MTNKKQNTSSQPTPADNEFIYWFIGGLLAVACYFIIKMLTSLTMYAFAVFTFLPWMANAIFGRIGLVITLLLMAIICFAIDLWVRTNDKKKYKGEDPLRAHSFLYFAGAWVILSIWHAIAPGDPKETGLLWHITLICNPQNELNPYFSCKITTADSLGINYMSLVGSLILPSALASLCVLPTLIKGSKTLQRHPELLLSSPNNKSSDVEFLISKVAHEYAHLEFFKIINPNKYPQDSGVFERLKQSRVFATDEALIDGFVQRPNIIQESKSVGHKPQEDDYDGVKGLTFSDDLLPSINQERFYKVMAKQLGDLYTNIERLSPAMVLLLGCAIKQCCSSESEMSDKEAAKIKKETDERIDDIWRWLATDALKPAKLAKPTKQWPDGYNLDKIKPLTEYHGYKQCLKDIQKWMNHDIMKEIMSKHAYINTILYAVVIKARSVGGFQPSSSRWLKLYDRSLYALLQNIGASSVFAENMGSVSHYYAEVKSGQKLYKPNFESAYLGFEERLSMFLYTDEDDQLLADKKLSYRTNIREHEFGFTDNNQNSAEFSVK